MSRGQDFDLIIIGGGINGAGIARDAALRGLKVLLLEKGDFASGTSSRSTKLIHGGIRYLENFEFKLVWEACHERKILTTIASQLVHPLPFIIPSYRGDKRPLWFIRLGMFLYDLMAGFQNIHRHQALKRDKITTFIPGLEMKGLKGGGVYFDCQTNDSRLTLANIQDAARYGAVVKNYMKVVNITAAPTQQDGSFMNETHSVANHRSATVPYTTGATGLSVSCEDVLSGVKSIYTAPYIVNATGPWLDLNQHQWDIFKKTKPTSNNKLRLTKGIHFFIPALTKEYALLISSKQDNRVFFIIPWGNFSLVGTTDTDYTDPPDDVKVEKKDIEYLLTELKRLFPTHHFDQTQIFGEYAGLRPLLNIEGGKTGALSREYTLEELHLSEGTMLSVIGGKITTYRHLAQKVTDKVVKALEKPSHRSNHKALKKYGACETHIKHLPGSQFNEARFDEFKYRMLQTLPELQKLEPDISENLLKTYGSEIMAFFPYLHKPHAKERIISEQPFIWAQLFYAIEYEYIKTAQDFIYRRTELYLHLKKYPQLQVEVTKKIQKFL